METKKNKGVFFKTVLIILLSSLIGGVSGSFITQQLIDDSNSTPQTVQTQTVATTITTDYSLADVVDQIESSVVEVNTVIQSRSNFGRQTTSTAAGSGVIVAEDGYIVTNYHVIEGSTSVSVRLTNGESYDATIIATDESNDLALLKINESGLNAAEFADSDTLRVGQTTIAIGNPLGTLGGTVTEGILSATDREIEIDGVVYTLLQTSAAINSGNSGGGLFDETGALIGIVNAKSSGLSIEGLGFAIPSNQVLAFLNSIDF